MQWLSASKQQREAGFVHVGSCAISGRRHVVSQAYTVIAQAQGFVTSDDGDVKMTELEAHAPFVRSDITLYPC
jgi:hypothetical protein